MFFGSMLKTTCKAVSGAVDLTHTKLSQQAIGSTMLAKLSLSKVALGCLSPAIPSEGKTWRPDGGTLESEEMGHFSVKLLLFSHWRHFYTWNLRLCGYLKSNHVYLVEINNQVFYSCWLGENSNGNGTEGLLILGAFRVLVDWCSLFVWAPKGIMAGILHAVKSADWIDCLL